MLTVEEKRACFWRKKNIRNDHHNPTNNWMVFSLTTRRHLGVFRVVQAKNNAKRDVFEATIQAVFEVWCTN